MEALEINPILIIAQMISFGLVYLVFSRFLFPRLRTALDERREAVNKTFADKAEIEHRLLAIEEEQKAAKRQTAADIQKMMSEARDSAAATKADLVAKAKEAANVEVAAAQKRIEQEKATAEAEVAKHAKSLAQSIVQQILTDKSSDPQWQQQQIKAGLDALKQNKS